MTNRAKSCPQLRTNNRPLDTTVWLKWIAHFAVDVLLLRHYKSDLAHLSDFDSLVIDIPKSER